LIDPSGDVVVADGADQGFVISAGGGYEIEDVLVDGVSVGAVSEYTFYGVDSDHTISASFTTTAWWNSAWSYRRAITVDHTKVSDTQTNFAVLVEFTNSGLVGKVQTDGDDFVFTTANNVKLAHEIESYDSSTGSLVAWVNVPLLSSTADTVLYLYYGNLVCENQQNPEAVWDTNYKLVQHLNEQTGNLYDSTLNGNDGVPYDGLSQGITGKIDGAAGFDGVNDYVEVAHSNALTGYTDAFTVSFWVKLEDTTRRQAILNKYDTAGNQRGWFIEYRPYEGTTRFPSFFASADGVNYVTWFAEYSPSAGTWYHVTVVWQANAIPTFYINGQQVPTIGSSTLPQIYNNVNAPLHIGSCTYNSDRYLKGSLDEIRISTSISSANRISTLYNNQVTSTAFCAVGIEENY
jgi:hypothetical protein